MKKKPLLLYLLMMILGMTFLCQTQHALVLPCSAAARAPEEKIVYLTFDDGPTPQITDHILDALKAQNVKATFFIVGKEIKGREAILKRIYEEGHAIGLHTYSHNFKIIYKNPETFISEMQKTNETINEVLGTNLDIKLIRFPGGSAGRLNKNFYQKLSEKGYLIFDWNVDLQDGIKGHLSPEAFLENAKKCSDRSNRRIILAHCNSNNQNTCEALDDIIGYYQSQGYVFKPLDDTTKPYHYRIKN